MSHQDSASMPRQIHGVQTLAGLATQAAKGEVAAGTHDPHAGHTGVVTSDAVPAERQSRSEMTPEE